MADKYRDFLHLRNQEVEGVDYRIQSTRADDILIIAPHGGGIEPGTSELAEAIAGVDHSLYLFEGLKNAGNGALHITSSNFDEPTCLEIVAQADRVVAVHGEDRSDPIVFVGGLDAIGIARMSESLACFGFTVKAPDRDHLTGQSPHNICNRGRSGGGIQLEITEGLRRSFFRAMSPRSERQHRTTRFNSFVDAVRDALC